MQPCVLRPSGFSRRTFLGTTGGALAALWANWSRAATEQTPSKPRAQAVILIFNCGGPSHIDLWDPKPHAPDTVRGVFRPISTSVPDIHISELLPRMAERMDQLAIVRTVHHQHSSHNGGMHWSIVGRPYRVDSTLVNPSPTDLPSVGTLTGWLAQRDGYSGSVPPYVITPSPHCDSPVYITPGQYGGCLGVRYDPLVVNADPNSSDFKVRNLSLAEGLSRERLEDRLKLLHQFSAQRPTVASPTAAEYDVHHRRASNIVISGEAANAFDLSQEPAKVRERYGRHTWGQSHLLARRLIEAGARFVTTVNGPSITWDTHQNNFEQHKNRLVPPMEQAFAALLDDLSERGLLGATLVVWMGDFGRTPKINKDVGRDHWPNCYSMVLAGGGIRGGQVVGQSDAQGAYPVARGVQPADIHATMFAALGYDPHAITYHTADGRPIPLSEGQVLRELL